MKKIFIAYLSSLTGVFSGLFTQLVFIKLLTKILSSNEFSLYSYIFQIIAYFNILQLGLDFTASREIAYSLGHSDKAGANDGFYFIKSFNQKLVGIGFLVIILLSVLFHYNIGLAPNVDNNKAILLIVYFGISQLLNFLCRPFAAALVGSNFQSWTNINNAVVNISATFFAVCLLLFTPLGMLSMPLSLVFINICNFFFLRKLCFNKCQDWLTVGGHKVPKGKKNGMLSFSILSTLGGLAWTIEATSDVFILNKAGLFPIVGLFVVWWRFPQMLFDLVTRFTTSAFPTLTASHGKDEHEKKILFNKVLIYVVGLSALVGFGIALWLPTFIFYWLGKNYLFENNSYISILISLVIITRIIGNYLGMYIISLGRAKLSSIFSWIQAIVKIFTGIILTNYYGVVGLLIASLLASLSQVLLYLIIFFKESFLYRFSWLMLLFPYCLTMITGFYYLPFLSLFLFIIGVLVSIIGIYLVWYLTLKVSGHGNYLYIK